MPRNEPVTVPPTVAAGAVSVSATRSTDTAPHSVWNVAGLSERFLELHKQDHLSFSLMAAQLNREFDLHPPLSRNSCVGRANRMHLPSHGRIARKEPKPAARELRGATARAPQPPVPHRQTLWDTKAPEPAPAEPSDVIPDRKCLTIWELGQHHCRFPYGTRAPFMFCGKTTAIDCSWCPEHLALVGRWS